MATLTISEDTAFWGTLTGQRVEYSKHLKSTHTDHVQISDPPRGHQPSRPSPMEMFTEHDPLLPTRNSTYFGYNCPLTMVCVGDEGKQEVESFSEPVTLEVIV